MRCGTRWVVRQADDPFVCFGAKPNKGLGLKFSDETRSGEKRQLVKESREDELAKEDAEGQWTTEQKRPVSVK